MFEKKITFSTQEICKDLNIEKPIPIKLNIPNWYKKLKHSFVDKNIKGCIPFLETLTTGYLLKTDQDFFINHNFVNEDGKRSTYNCPSLSLGMGSHLNNLNVNLNLHENINHTPEQLRGSDILKNNNNLHVHKFMNPWIIKTPPGYSCLFLPPMNNPHEVFEIIPGIVDTDTYEIPVNFPFLIKAEKKKNIQTIIKKGTPYVQIIPFKKESWKMNIEYFSNEDMAVKNSRFNILSILDTYKNNFWKKTKWK